MSSQQARDFLSPSESLITDSISREVIFETVLNLGHNSSIEILRVREQESAKRGLSTEELEAAEKVPTLMWRVNLDAASMKGDITLDKAKLVQSI